MNIKPTTSDFASDFEKLTRKSEGIGLRVKEGREKLGISQQELSRKVGVSITTIQNYEGGQLPKGDHAIKLSYVLQISLDFLFLGTEHEPQQTVKTQEIISCSRCADLEKEREERRELTQENRQLWKKTEQLARENGDLKTEVAVQREQLKSLSGRSVAVDCA